METQNITAKQTQDINSGANGNNTMSHAVSSSIATDSPVILSAESYSDRWPMPDLNFNIFGFGNNSSF
ncbi:hypothetical protein [Mucilaginibacter glaciei]|uniref:Uncharacterized protein n=1 Tax=Mucilaginibacter glaciei TaxID=2772109 RepID=A0A926NVI5_9SPHI|nr:hypothetical protein [Mucilaginibacter glaciei]MBD1392563.1 hypothetical protein [Mucilaginibacter glaciei]